MNGGHLLTSFGIWCLCLGQVAAQIGESSTNSFESSKHESEEVSVSAGSMNNVSVELSEAEKAEFLKAHNDVRRRQGATNMLRMVWDEELAVRAQTQANYCGHLNPSHANGADLNLGQNRKVTWEVRLGGPPVNYTAVTFAWANERQYWNFFTNKCEEEKTCDHWRILTGAASRRLGCGKADCSELTDSGTERRYMNFIVCNYEPSSSSFERGPSCSLCYNSTIRLQEKGYTCEDELCVPCVPKRKHDCKCGPAYSCLHGGQYSPDICGCVCPPNFYGTYCEIDPVVARDQQLPANLDD